MRTSRLEALSDGVFAIAATLLILNVSVGQGRLAGELIRIWPSYAAYAVSFVTIGIIWINHHAVMAQIGHVDRVFLMLSVLFLAVIAFIPFPTRLLAESILRPEDVQAAALAYGVVLTLTAVMFNALWWYAARGNRLLRADADQRTVDGISRSYLPGPFLYGAATAIALINPYVSAALYCALALFYVLESAIFGSRA
jgi:uncharacterized membrane protein